MHEIFPPLKGAAALNGVLQPLLFPYRKLRKSAKMVYNRLEVNNGKLSIWFLEIYYKKLQYLSERSRNPHQGINTGSGMAGYTPH